MQCISPLTLLRNGLRDIVPCGKCNYCLSTKRQHWSFRLKQEAKVASSAHFLTLTYNDDTVPVSEHGELELSKRDFQLFMKKARKFQDKISDKKMRYYAVGEYGTKTDRPHYHAIMYNMTQLTTAYLSAIWPQGIVHIGTVTPKSIAYVTKYVINRHGDYNDRAKPFALMSRRPGLGTNYLTPQMRSYHRVDSKNYVNDNGHKASLPRFYKDKLFTTMEKSIMSKKAIIDGDIRYTKELQRLSSLHKNPDNYIDERNVFHHDSVKNKVNHSNKY